MAKKTNKKSMNLDNDATIKKFYKQYSAVRKRNITIASILASILVVSGGLTAGHFAYKWYNRHSPGDTPAPVVGDKFVVQFESNGGSVVIAEQIEKGKKATRPANPTKDDYDFVDWYLDKSFTQKYDFNSEVKSNLVLYAKWKIPDTKTGIGYALNEDKTGFLAYCNDYETIPSKVCIPSTHSEEGLVELPVVGIMYHVEQQEGDQNKLSADTLGFEGCSNIVEIELPETFTNLPSKSFHNCYSLRKINIPSNVSYIGPNCFQNCYALQDVTFPEGLLKIDDYAFNNCYSLKNIKLPDSLITIGERCFEYCTGIENIIIGNNLNTISFSCFYGDNRIKTVTLPYSVTYVAQGAFYASDRVFDIEYNIKDDVSEWVYNSTVISTKDELCNLLNSGAELNKQSYKDTKGMFNVQFIGYENEENKEGLLCSIGKAQFLKEKDVTIPSEVEVQVGEGDPIKFIVKRISNNGFKDYYVDKDNDIKVKIPSTVETIGEYAFNNCKKLKTVEFEEGSQLIGIGDLGFGYCENLSSFNTTDEGFINIPEGVQYLGKNCFCKMNDSTNKVYIPSTLHDLKFGYDNPFYHSKIKQFEVSENNPYYMNDEDGWLYTKKVDGGISYIDGLVMLPYFEGDSITIKSGINQLLTGAFDLLLNNGIDNIKTINLTKDLTSINNALDNLHSLTSITVDSNSNNYVTDEGVLYNKDKTTLIRFPGDKLSSSAEKSFVVPNTVTRINNCAFYKNANLESITLNDNLEYIGESTFEGCNNLKDINLPSSLSHVGYRAFYNCDGLFGGTGQSTIKIDSLYVINCYIDYTYLFEYINYGGCVYLNDDIKDEDIDKLGYFYNHFYKDEEQTPTIEGYTRYTRS